MEERSLKEFWESRYQEGSTGWDLGEVSPPLKAYCDQLKDKDLAILIPGCGNGYEAIYLAEQGFRQVTVVDIAPSAIEALHQVVGNKVQLIESDFFKLAGSYDLILEQTFFCALEPVLRPDYVKQVFALLRPGGKLVGVLFDKIFSEAGPPFGGTASEYRDLFAPYFDIITFEPCYNSVKPRAGSELFVILQKKSLV